jgi:hypothetical protein
MILTWIRTIAFLLLNIAQIITLMRSSAFTARKAWR